MAASDNTKGNPRMLNAPSPYLRIHASDLVQWRAWSEETFELARKENKPLMVSFGYTACHWCHVMQETHFTVEDIAKTINENFIPVIVDRERRPVLDETYMLVTEVLTNRGGWPNTVFMTADKKPFYGTGYTPADNFRKIMVAVIEGWQNDNSAVLAEADRLSSLLQNYLTRKEEAKELTPELMRKSANDLADSFDEFVGGFGGAPKFFQQSILMFLLQQAERDNNVKALAAVELTLKSIISGGIHDHIEGGVHRYSVDPAWRIPHFEKMLYDQAMMSEVYTEAWRITGKVEYGRMARRILDYVLDDLTAPEGGFYATRDADSEGEEGTYYVWSKQQLETVLGAEDAKYAIDTFEQVADGELAGKVILNRDRIREQTVPRIENILLKLGKARSGRPKPQRDEKIVVSWNGMMISAMARAALLLNDDRYAAAANRAGEFIWNNMRRKNGTMLRSYFAEKAEVDAELIDYAWLARSFIKLHDLSGHQVWLQRARQLLAVMETRFADKQEGDFYSSREESGFGRSKSRQDSDMASGNGVALGLIVDITNRAGSPDMQRRSEELISALSGFAAQSPIAGASILTAADRYFNGDTGPVQFGGNGNVRALARFENGRFIVQLQVARGWHINANRPLEEYLVPTSLAVKSPGEIGDVTYPEPLIKDLGFSKKPLALLEGDVEISTGIPPGGPASAELEIQACSDEICLAPDTLTFTVSEAPPAG
ncbi:MAG: DUF255 domain-containing protein [Rhodobacteraceae bacterium]|nr:DUF255 domain-containing protein [Paracoccaceae bacterium]